MSTNINPPKGRRMQIGRNTPSQSKAHHTATTPGSARLILSVCRDRITLQKQPKAKTTIPTEICGPTPLGHKASVPRTRFAAFGLQARLTVLLLPIQLPQNRVRVWWMRKYMPSAVYRMWPLWPYDMASQQCVCVCQVYVRKGMLKLNHNREPLAKENALFRSFLLATMYVSTSFQILHLRFCRGVPRVCFTILEEKPNQAQPNQIEERETTHHPRHTCTMCVK